MPGGKGTSPSSLFDLSKLWFGSRRTFKMKTRKNSSGCDVRQGVATRSISQNYTVKRGQRVTMFQLWVVVVFRCVSTKTNRLPAGPQRAPNHSANRDRTELRR